MKNAESESRKWSPSRANNPPPKLTEDKEVYEDYGYQGFTPGGREVPRTWRRLRILEEEEEGTKSEVKAMRGEIMKLTEVIGELRKDIERRSEVSDIRKECEVMKTSQGCNQDIGERTSHCKRGNNKKNGGHRGKNKKM